jgi:CBS domain-containing protein
LAPPDPLLQVSELLKQGKPSPKVSVRTFLSWFGAQRRGSFVVYLINETLRGLKLATNPDFEYAYIDSEITFIPREQKTSEGAGAAAPAVPIAEAAAGSFIGGVVQDPTYRIGKLPSANNPPLSVQFENDLNVATTLMLSHDFSQLPVMQNERQVKGIVTWSSIGSRMSLGRTCSKVRDCIEQAFEVSSEISLFAAIDLIVRNQYVLVRDVEGKISGIVTTSDLSLQFGQLGEPFLLAGEIEQHIRRLIHNKFTNKELEAAKYPGDSERTVMNVADLTLGEYVRLLENKDNWKKLNLNVDQTVFVKELQEIRDIRNDIMHFDPDGISDQERSTLRRFVAFMQELNRIGVT